jgi:tetratricopeptide (TPR) repeat protein
MTPPEQLYAQLVDAFRQGRWQNALEIAGELIPQAPEHPGVFSIAGVACMELGEFRPAIEHLRRAAELDSTRADFATLHAKALSAGGLHAFAMDAVDRALALNPADPMTLDTLGLICIRAQEYPRAIEAFRRAVALFQHNAQYRFNLATALIATGNLEEAEAELEHSIALAPRYWNPHLSLARLRQQTSERNHLSRLLPLLEHHEADVGARTYLNMSLAKEYEDLGDYPKAFAHLVRGKAASRRGLRYSIDQDEALFDLVMRSFPTEQPALIGDPNEEAIFVVGMPRSGTTLVERILSSHPDVHGAGELQNFAQALQQVSGHRGSFVADPAAMAHLQELDWKRLGSTYIASTRPSTGHTRRFVDKLPHNFLFLGFIVHALPRARIVCLKRDPVDTCLSNFQQLFEPGSAHFGYSFDLLDTGRYYILFDRLMRHWKQIFSGRILELDYESLVSRQEATTRELLTFCDLPWHDACLRFERNTAPVATLSAVQVRQSMNAGSVGRWRNYRPELSALLELLVDAAVEVNIEPN